MTTTGFRAILALSMALLAAAPAAAVESFLDRTFHPPDGYLTWGNRGALSADGLEAALQPDGKIVVMGTTIVGSTAEIVVMRTGVAGGFDPAFGSGKGYIMLRSGPNLKSYPCGMKIQPESGKILVAATLYDEIDGSSKVLLHRFNPDGAPDVSFGGGAGKVEFRYSDYEVNFVNDLLLLQDGRIMVVGGGRPEADKTVGYVVVLHRRMADGGPDPSFGGGVGAVLTTVPPASLFKLGPAPGGFRLPDWPARLRPLPCRALT